MASSFCVLPGLLTCRPARSRSLGLPELDAGSTCFRETDSDGLLRGSCAMFSFADVMNLFAHELSGLAGGRLAFSLVFFRSSDAFFFGHGFVVLPEQIQRTNGATLMPQWLPSTRGVLGGWAHLGWVGSKSFAIM